MLTHSIDLTAVCEETCLNGGICSAPNKCTCLDGYRGLRCQKGRPIDLDKIFSKHQNWTRLSFSRVQAKVPTRRQVHRAGPVPLPGRLRRSLLRGATTAQEDPPQQEADALQTRQVVRWTNALKPSKPPPSSFNHFFLIWFMIQRKSFRDWHN